MKNKYKSISKAIKYAFPSSIPVLTGFSVIGIAYGILMDSKGYGPLWSVLFSAFAFCGSMQFVAITFLSGSFEPLQVLIMSLMVNARHLFYGLSMLDKYKGCGKLKGLLIYYLCDETFAINSTAEIAEDIDKKDFYLAVSLLNMFYWVGSSFIGALLANILNFNTAGLDFALTALFIVLLIEQVKTKKNATCAGIGILSAMLSLFFFGAENMVIPAMIIIVIILLGGKNYLCD